MEGSYHPEGPTCSRDVMKIVWKLGGDIGQLEHFAVCVVVCRPGCGFAQSGPRTCRTMRAEDVSEGHPTVWEGLGSEVAI
jgi:hypothetical protein